MFFESSFSIRNFLKSSQMNICLVIAALVSLPCAASFLAATFSFAEYWYGNGKLFVLNILLKECRRLEDSPFCFPAWTKDQKTPKTLLFQTL